MKFELFSHVSWPEDRDATQVVNNLTDEVKHGEDLGFYRAWHAEHHFTRYGIGSSSMVLGTHLAARTSKIRLGTAVLLPTLHHPLRMAEDTATMDLVSGGRLDVGVGRGMDNWDYKAYKVDWNESQARFRESINIILGLWTTPDFSYEGEYFNIKNTNLVPPPLQKPHPPLYIAATRTQATMDFMAKTGHPLLVGQALDTDDAVDQCRRFSQLSDASGHNVSLSKVPFIRFFYVAETEKQAKKDAEGPLAWMMDMVSWRHTYETGSEVHDRLEDWRQARTTPEPDIDRLYQKRAFVGDPEQCTAMIKELEKEGIQHFGCYFSFGGMEHAKVMKSMELFAKEVMPNFDQT
jgi:alkanesulfonate monooxygenase SsuD/methylene tetrahydromethanopterin reductase-like flavin-dependent oxidoreductase (luciferase family)